MHDEKISLVVEYDSLVLFVSGYLKKNCFYIYKDQ